MKINFSVSLFCFIFALSIYKEHIMEESTVRQNLMDEPGYSPYCGAGNCLHRMPRTSWDPRKEQFTCTCGWVSQFPQDFIVRYKQKWNK